jgi:hypothetical protein
MNNNDDDDTGYKKPPKHTRFRKGQSGNPKGRPRKIKDPTRLLEIELDKTITIKDGSRMTKREAFMTALVNDAITGKNHSRPLLLALLNVSNPPQPFELSEDDAADLEKHAREFINAKKLEDDDDEEK